MITSHPDGLGTKLQDKWETLSTLRISNAAILISKDWLVRCGCAISHSPLWKKGGSERLLLPGEEEEEAGNMAHGTSKHYLTADIISVFSLISRYAILRERHTYRRSFWHADSYRAQQSGEMTLPLRPAISYHTHGHRSTLCLNGGQAQIQKWFKGVGKAYVLGSGVYLARGQRWVSRIYIQS